MKDKNKRQYSTKIEGEMTRLNYRGTTGIYPTTPIYKVVTENRIDTLETEWIIIAGADGLLRKERHVTILKEYGKISDQFGTYNPTYVKDRRLNGELLDIVLLKKAN